MMIDKALEADILRYHCVEQWRVGTIASQLNVHHSVVDRVISQAGFPKAERAARPSIMDPYLPFIVEQLRQYPKLTAARLYGMVKARGYPGGPSLFRQRIAELRPRPLPEAYLRLKTLPGEQAQVDWGHFGTIDIGNAKRPLMAFVMVLSWSRQIFLRFYLNQQMANFLRGHVEGFSYFGGIPKVLLYDNLKSAVLERRGDAIRFHPTLLELSAHYRYEPRPVAVARGNEKGRVERAIRYIRDNFFAGRQWQDLADLNQQAIDWCSHISRDRPCPENQAITVGEAFAQEQPQLMTLPDNPFATDECTVVSAGKTPYIRFDLNDYSIPHTHVRRTLSISATLTQVRILDGQEVIATHPRHYGKAEQVEQAEHIQALVECKHQARHHRGQDRLAKAAPSSQTLLRQAAERGDPLVTTVSLLEEQLAHYGAAELEIAITEALQQQVPHPNAVRQVLERRREQRQQPPPMSISLAHHPKAERLVVCSTPLKHYDQLTNRPVTPTTENCQTSAAPAHPPSALPAITATQESTSHD
jgi:transposase